MCIYACACTIRTCTFLTISHISPYMHRRVHSCAECELGAGHGGGAPWTCCRFCRYIYRVGQVSFTRVTWLIYRCAMTPLTHCRLCRYLSWMAQVKIKKKKSPKSQLATQCTDSSVPQGTHENIPTHFHTVTSRRIADFANMPFKLARYAFIMFQAQFWIMNRVSNIPHEQILGSNFNCHQVPGSILDHEQSLKFPPRSNSGLKSQLSSCSWLSFGFCLSDTSPGLLGWNKNTKHLVANNSTSDSVQDLTLSHSISLSLSLSPSVSQIER